MTPILAIANSHKPFVLEIDASNRAIGYVVLLQDGRHVAYKSKKLDRVTVELLCV